MISLDEIKKIQNERKNIKKEIYKRIYNDFSRKIKKAVEVGQDQIILKTPKYIFGFPSYDVSKATKYIKRQFDHSGFTTHIFYDDELYVSWAQTREPKRDEPVQEDDDFPTFVNLKKMANKLRK